jgi:hypothetical protein
MPTQLLLFSPLINIPLKSTVLRTGEAYQSVAQEINCASPRPHVSLIAFQPSFKIVKHIIGNPGTIVFRDCPSGIFLPGSFTCSPIELFFCRIGPAPRLSTEGVAITYLVVSLWQRQGHQLILLKLQNPPSSFICARIRRNGNIYFQ